ncbi:hypothetical protein CQJ30_11070 [Caldibacillus thermoamylovorans]|uniref:hypothetical protein n=1 Tax=Caldibacillus thermoamylovorans TaxID=35841 RepID=UPI000D55CEA3|nr:hypothetical protein [Caldibacillus thermoamylovorans]AWI12644.1 hypothetical protein CQJ30_11070 [Caldibacillus thermoamylovorans]
MDIKQEFLNINITKNNSEVVLLLCTAVLSEIILNRHGIYTKNDYLKNFTTEVLEKEYKDYLFSARPTLFARIVKDIREHQIKEVNKFVKIAKNIQAFLKDSEKNESDDVNKQKGKQRKDKKDVIDAWRAVIES